MRSIGLLALLGMVPMWAGEMPEKAVGYHAALMKRPESAQLFERFRDAWLEERSTEELEKELLARAEGGEAGAWAILARSYLAAGRSEQALAAFDKARAESPAAWLDLESAGLRLAAKDFAAAEKDALAVPEGNTKRPDALKLAGLACLRAERIDEALAYWTQAVAAAPGDIGLLEDLTELTRREGRFDLALEYCGKWRDATHDAYGKAMATIRRSELLLGSQRFDEAMSELAEVFKVSADDSWLEREAMARAEQAHRQRGDATGWATWIGGQAEVHPTRLGFRRSHAQALAAAGNTDEALEVLTEVMRRSPGDHTVRWQRIGLLEQSMKLAEAYEECVELAAKEKSETAGLRLAELAFRLEKKAEVKQALDRVMAAADSGKRVNLASLYSRYGLPEESERIWRADTGGELGGIALRQLAKHLKTAGREREAIDVWKQLGAREVAQDRIEAAQMLAAAGEREAARGILENGRAKFSSESGYEAAVADLAMAEGKADEARAIYHRLARAAKQPDDLSGAVKGWLRTSAGATDPLKNLGEETADRCLRAAWLAAAGKPVPAVIPGDELERSTRQALLREHGRWAEVVAMMEAIPGERGPLLLGELAEAKSAAGDLPGALAAAQAWRARVPDQPGPWLFEAGILEKLNNSTDATTLLRRAAARFEDNEDVARRLFLMLEDSIDPRESLEWAWKRHDRSGDEAVRSGWLQDILRVSKEREKLDDLQERFEERARRDPASPGPLMALAELAKARGDSQAALDLLRRAAGNAPRDMAVISALATLEEQSGETARALERYETLARLAPGPESARQLAQAKIRLGDIEGGMRDLQAMAGENGIDLRALEQSAGDLASRGYVEEATRLFAAVDPAHHTARLNFMLGMLLEIDGRESEAADAFIKVLSEPDDPAESRPGTALGYIRTRQYTTILQSSSGQDQAVPGVFVGLQMPHSLVEAKAVVKSRLSRLAMQHGGEIWDKAAQVLPELSTATPEQWREAMDFSQSIQSSQRASWWDFIKKHPGNPLAVELLVDQGQHSSGTPQQVEALLKTDPPLRLEMMLRMASGTWRMDHLEFLESIDPAGWQDESIRNQALYLVERMFMMAFSESAEPPVGASECSRGLALLEKAGLGESQASHLSLMRARLALLEEKPDEFVKHINAWVTESEMQNLNQINYGAGLPLDAFEHWRKIAGDTAAEDLIARIESPVLRCQISLDADPAQQMARVNRELAALPENAPRKTRRGLIQWKWSLYQRNAKDAVEYRAELEAAAKDPDPMLAFLANIHLMSSAALESGMTEADRLKIQELVRNLAGSPDPEDQQYAAQYGGFYGASHRHSRMRNSTVVATRWGAGGHFSAGYNRSRSNQSLTSIIAMGDRDQAVREAARFLESSARASGGKPQNLRQAVKSLSDAGLLGGALEKTSLPPDAGLGRRVAMLTLMDAASQGDRARSLLGEIAKSRPWETRWTVDLALRTPDEAEMRRLLDSVAERGDFDRILGDFLAPQNREEPEVLFTQLMRLAEWAPQAKGHRDWMEKAMSVLLNNGGDRMNRLAPENEPQLRCFRRYVELALDDWRQGELGFRMTFAARHMEMPEFITHAARRAILSGAYTSNERTFPNASRQGDMALSALEHLVMEAGISGDEAAFPAEFRERLKVTDPASEAWFAKMLAAKSVTELPDISNTQAKSAGWVALARHQAALFRAAKMPGRDAWLTGIFRESEYLAYPKNLQHVVRESLMDAAKTRKMKERIFALLEAAAGPRRSWNQEPTRNHAVSHPDAESPVSLHLPQAATFILTSAGNADATTLLAVLDIFREARVPVSDADSVFTRLGQEWRQQEQSEGKTTLAALLGDKPDAPFTLGVWKNRGGSSLDPQFVWGLPQLVRGARIAGRNDLAKAVKENPDSGFLDLVQAWLDSGDRTLQRRALLKAAPDLAKHPEEIRHAVIDSLINGMGAADLKGLPSQAAARLEETLEAASKLRIKSARQTYERIKSRPTADQSFQLGSMLGPVIGDDEAYVAEVLADWRPLAEADPSGKESEALLGGMISNSAAGSEWIMTFLRLLDSLSKDSLIDWQRNTKSGDPMQNLWSRLGPKALADPEFWREVAALSPRLQGRFWSGGPQYAENGNFAADPSLVKALREAAKGGEVTRTALEWCLQCAAMRRDQDTKVDGEALLHFVQAMIDAGASAEVVAQLLHRGFQRLSRFENPGPVMAQTPTLLAGLESFPVDYGDSFFHGVQNLWDQVQRERQRDSGDHSNALLPAPVYPVETAALLKFFLTRKFEPSRINHHGRGLTPIVIATGDAELFELWIKFSGKSLVGDLPLILELLKKDRVDEAVALAPAAGSNFTSSGRFSSQVESLIPKLHTVSTTQSFFLLVRLSLMNDAYGLQKPVEAYPARVARLTGEFERLQKNLTTSSRAELCLMLGLSQMGHRKQVPALDEFANEAAAKDFEKWLITGKSSSTIARLFVPAVCSRVFADDLSGVALLTTAITAAPPRPRGESSALEYAILPLQSCLVIYASRHDMKIPGDSVQVIHALAKALAGHNNPAWQGVASLFVHLAATDAASLEAGLKGCGLEGVKPVAAFNPNIEFRADSDLMQALMRTALLHPIASEALLESFGMPPHGDPSISAILPALHESTLRARISPTLFLKWVGPLQFMQAKDLEAVNLYATERRADFDEEQCTELDALLARLEDSNSLDPSRINNLRRQQTLDRMRMHDDQRRRDYEDRMRNRPPR